MILATIAYRYGQNSVGDGILAHVDANEALLPTDRRFRYTVLTLRSERSRGRLEFSQSAATEREAAKVLRITIEEERNAILQASLRGITEIRRMLLLRKALMVLGKRQKAITILGTSLMRLWLCRLRFRWTLRKLRGDQRAAVKARYLFEFGDIFQWAFEFTELKKSFKTSRSGQSVKLSPYQRLLAAIAAKYYAAAAVLNRSDPDYHNFTRTRSYEMQLHVRGHMDELLKDGLNALEQIYVFEHGGSSSFARSEQYNRLFLVRAMAAYYGGDLQRALKIAQEIEVYFASYEQITGVAKAKLLKARAYRVLGWDAERRREIEEIVRLMKGAT